MYKKIGVSLVALFVLSGCAKLSVDEKNAARSKIDTMAQTTIEALIKDNSQIEEELKTAKGYAVINWKVTKVPVVGAGGGNGVIVDLRNNERTYVNVSRFDIGGGWGVRSYKNLVITHSDKILDEAKTGTFKFEAGAEVAAGTAGVDGGSGALNSDMKTYMLLDGGGSATATVRMLYSTLDSELN